MAFLFFCFLQKMLKDARNKKHWQLTCNWAWRRFKELPAALVLIVQVRLMCALTQVARPRLESGRKATFKLQLFCVIARELQHKLREWEICSKDQLRIHNTHNFIDVVIDHHPHARNSYQSSVNPSCDHMAFWPCPTSWIASLERLLGQQQENPKDRVPRSALSLPMSVGRNGPWVINRLWTVGLRRVARQCNKQRRSKNQSCESLLRLQNRISRVHRVNFK